MDAAALRAHAEARARFDHTVQGPHGPRRFTLRIVSQHELEVAALQVRSEFGRRRANERAFSLAMFRRALEVALLDWQGVTAGEIAPDVEQPDELQPFDAGLAALYLDEPKLVAAELAAVLAERVLALRSAIDKTKKN